MEAAGIDVKVSIIDVKDTTAQIAVQFFIARTDVEVI